MKMFLIDINNKFIIMFVKNIFYEVITKNNFLKINLLEKIFNIIYNLQLNNNKINSESCYKIVKIDVTYN